MAPFAAIRGRLRDGLVGGISETSSVEHGTRDLILAAGPTVVALAALLSAFVQQLRGFGHEREMHDLADVRQLLDAATAALTNAMNSAPDYIRAAMRGESDAADQELAWWDVLGAALTMQTRMMLRLGRNHPACVTYDAVITALTETATDVQKLRLAGNQHAEIDARGKRGAKAVANAYGVFVDAASEVAKVKLP